MQLDIIPGRVLTPSTEHNVGLNYGAYPKKISKTLKIPLEEGTLIFDRFHNVLYPGVTNYRENYVLPTAEKNGRLHLGLGCYIATDNPKRDIRTLNNASCQFWSILTLLAVNKMHQLIDEAGMQDDIQCVSTIYDSIYYVVREDAAVIKWLNDHLVPIMLTDFMGDQAVKNEAAAEIGLNWADLYQIPNNASLQDIEATLHKIEGPE